MLETPGPGLTLVTGPNGGGKSTLARALVARVPGARLLSAESQQAFYESELSAVDSDFQEAVDPGTSVGELLGEVGLSHALFAAFGLERLWDRGYLVLSTGEARKVLLLQAVAQEPSLLVLDEPFDGLDRSAQAELASALVYVSARLPVVVVAAAGLDELPFTGEAVSEVVVVEGHRAIFRGSAAALTAQGARAEARHAPPPVHLGSWYEPLDPEPLLVELRHGHVRYGEQTVFEGLDLRVERGQHTLIEGPNGSGKSSLLDMLTGDHPQAYDNELYLFGRRRGSGESVWDIKQKIGGVSARLHRDYRVGGSVEEALLSGLYDSIGVYRKPEPSHRIRARAWLDWLGLELSPTTAFRDLSFGQQRLVLIARAAIKLPPLLVLDEPTSGLDADSRRRVLELVESLCTQRKSTVLMVTHRADERVFWEQRIGGARLSMPARLSAAAPR